MWNKLNRRDFVKTAVGAGAAMKVLGRAPIVMGNVRGANDRINIAMIGVGGRGSDLLGWVMKTGDKPETPAHVVAVCDVYAKRLNKAKETAKCDGFMDYHEVLDKKDVDAVRMELEEPYGCRT